MALLQRILLRGTRAWGAPFCVSLSSGTSTTDAKDQTPTTPAPTESTSPEEGGTPTTHYRTNSLLPKLAFLFPAQPRAERKRLHLHSLRRAKLSTASCLQSQRSRTCAWCGAAAVESESFCPHCHKILPVEGNLNLFRIFDLEPEYEIDVSELEVRYKAMQMKLHPDRFATKEQHEQDLATAQASVINKAYHKLKNPLDRAKYLLSLKGFRFDKEQTINDSEFLMEMLEIQEKVSETDDKEELLDVMSETHQRKTLLEKRLSRAFTQNELHRASDIVTELSYIDRILKQLKEKM